MTTPFEKAAAAVAGGADAVAEAAALVAEMTPEERRWCLDGDLPFWAGLGDLGTGGYHKRTFPAAVVERLGVPGFRFSDGPRGVVIGPATAFPVSMGRGATWDVDLEERIGDAIGQELRAVGADLYGGVCVNVLRHPAWGRAQETYGEDPHHVGELGAALTRGVQRHAMACVKHFACNSMENARFKVDVTVDDEALHEVFLPHFRRIVDEGVASVTSPASSAAGSPSLRIMRAGISTSSPAVTDGPASRRPKIQSLMTKPSKPHSSRSTAVSRAGLCPHHSPLTLL